MGGAAAAGADQLDAPALANDEIQVLLSVRTGDALAPIVCASLAQFATREDGWSR